MLPESFWGRIQYLLQQYGASFLSGAGNTMIIAIVGTFLGCLIGFIVGIIQTIRFDLSGKFLRGRMFVHDRVL